MTKEKFHKKIEELKKKQQQEREQWELLNKQREDRYGQLLTKYKQEQEEFAKNEEIRQKLLQEAAKDWEHWEEHQRKWKLGMTEKDQCISTLQSKYNLALQEKEAHEERLEDLKRKLDSEQRDRRQSLENQKQIMDQERALRQELIDRVQENIEQAEKDKQHCEYRYQEEKDKIFQEQLEHQRKLEAQEKIIPENRHLTGIYEDTIARSRRSMESEEKRKGRAAAVHEVESMYKKLSRGEHHVQTPEYEWPLLAIRRGNQTAIQGRGENGENGIHSYGEYPDPPFPRDDSCLWKVPVPELWRKT